MASVEVTLSVGLPGGINKNTGHPVKFKFQIDNKSFENKHGPCNI